MVDTLIGAMQYTHPLFDQLYNMNGTSSGLVTAIGIYFTCVVRLLFEGVYFTLCFKLCSSKVAPDQGNVVTAFYY